MLVSRDDQRSGQDPPAVGLGQPAGSEGEDGIPLGVEQPGRPDGAVTIGVAGVEAAGVHGRADGGGFCGVGYPDLPLAQPEGAAHGTEPEQVPGAEGYLAATGINAVVAWVWCIHTESLARRARTRHRPLAGSRYDPSRRPFYFGRCRARRTGPSLEG